MAVAGIDVGAKYIKTILLDEDNEIIARSKKAIGFDTASTLEEVLSESLGQVGLKQKDLNKCIATGTGRKEVPFADEEVTEISAVAKGAIHLFPHCRTVMDVGAEEGRAMRCKGDGKVVDFVINEKCAAGAGIFTETMARALELSLEDLASLSLKSQKAVPMNAQCAVFAESEVVSLIHQRIPKEDISRAIHDAIASRIISMARKIGFQPDIVIVGGVARNKGFLESMKRGIEYAISVPEEPEYIGALGAALIAAENV